MNFNPEGNVLLWQLRKIYSKKLNKIDIDRENYHSRIVATDLIFANVTDMVISPDGTKITFELCWGCPWSDGYSIGVFDILTKELTRVTKHWETLGHPAYDYNPFWSFDGEQIVFTSDRDYITGDSLRYRTDLYIINTDGTELERITENGKAMNPIWSNAGNKISTNGI